MEIQSAFADRYDFPRPSQIAQLRNSIGSAIFGVVGMHADGSKDIFVLLGNLDRHPIVFDRSDRADRDDLCDAGVGCARDHGFDVVAELRVCEMAMRVDQY